MSASRTKARHKRMTASLKAVKEKIHRKQQRAAALIDAHNRAMSKLDVELHHLRNQRDHLAESISLIEFPGLPALREHAFGKKDT